MLQLAHVSSEIMSVLEDEQVLSEQRDSVDRSLSQSEVNSCSSCDFVRLSCTLNDFAVDIHLFRLALRERLCFKSGSITNKLGWSDSPQTGGSLTNDDNPL